MKNRAVKSVSLLLIATLLLSLTACGRSSRTTKETEETTFGIDVAKYQGTINWQELAASGIDFAMVRLGYRGASDGQIKEDSNARYNLQEGTKAGVPLGAYFFSTAISEEEAVEEAAWVADMIGGYSITYPVVYDCEGFHNADSRQYGMTMEERTDIALAFLKAIEELGYEGMFYSSKYDLENSWEIGRIEEDYKIWVAQYPDVPYPATQQSSYEGTHQMWQYTTQGVVSGITQNVDLNVAYFGYDGIEKPKSRTTPDEVKPDPEALMDFDEVEEQVTAKEMARLRDIPSQGEDSTELDMLYNGEVAQRIAVSESGWSKLIFEGNTCYAVSSNLTTDLDYDPNEATQETEDDGIKTVFETVNEKVTPKDAVNLRTLPSTEHPEVEVVVKIEKGEIVTRTGINNDVGWSRVEYNGQTLYCISSYLTTVE